jgi:uncharacterized protein YciI
VHYLLFYDVVDNYAEKRAAFRKDHIAHAKAAVAESFAKADPYVANGLVTTWRVREWITVVGKDAEVPLPTGL